MKKRTKILGLALIGLLALASCKKKEEASSAKVLYVSPEGLMNAKGTVKDPVSFDAAIDIAEPGDTIKLLNGTYKYNGRIGVNNSGEANRYITVEPAEAENIVFDFSEMAFNGSNRGIQVYGDYWHFKNIVITGAGDNGMYIAGNHNIIEECIFYNNRDTGLQIGRGGNTETTLDEWPSYNLIKNCTSFANFDEETKGENADGFAAKLTVGYGNIFDGCIAFRNSDDGWDLYAKEDSGNIGTVVLYNCVSFENGYLPYTIKRPGLEGEYDSYDTLNGDGIGFKLGGSTMEGDVILNNCMAFNNKLHGFGDNSNPGVINIKNCTAFNNCIGLAEDGKVGQRGIEGVTNKSNNIDLARSIASYNNYYGVLSYINNQKNYDNSGDSAYNADAFRGSAAYSIFQTEYDGKAKKEIYKAFTGYEDASSYHTTTQDIAFSGGTDFTEINDESFVSLDAINAICNERGKLADLIKYHDSLRNEDGSVNMGDTLKVKAQNLLTFANGSPIGANLSKTNAGEYEHYGIVDFSNAKTENEVAVNAAYSVTEVLCDASAVYQDFEIPKLIHGCDIEWTSSNPDVISISNNEKVSVSTSVLGNATVVTPQTDTEVTLTAKISKGKTSLEKEFKVTVKSRNQSVGGIASTGDSAIRVNIYEEYIAPRIYPLDASSNNGGELPLSLYDMVYTYRYASSRISKYYKVDGVYTSVPGVYEVTAKATLKSNPQNSSTYTFNVYVVDPDCEIDFLNESVILTKDGFTLSGSLSNIEGDVYAVVSDSEINLTKEELLSREDVQIVPIETDIINAEFLADNSIIKDADVQYYVNYLVSNKNKSNEAAVKSFSVGIKGFSTTDEFYQLATTGKLDGVSTTTPMIYSLEDDLDFTDYTWEIKKKGNCTPFTGLLNGNDHTIKNLSINGSAPDGEATQTANVFYKVSNGTIMNINFEEVSIISQDTTSGKIVGIVGDLQGGYLHDIRMHNISAYGKEGVGALVGQVTGGTNYISQCQLVNDAPAEGEENKYIIASTNKYAGGIVGNCQKNSDQSYLTLTVVDCMAKAIIGDGKDSGGNTGGIVGRVKNESTVYNVLIERCYFKGKIIASGQYNAGIVGDFDNGLGHIIIRNNLADVSFNYKGEELDARNLSLTKAETYAHKNSNPIVGRATKAEVGIYETEDNVGTWTEYYADLIHSDSIVFDLATTNEETGLKEPWEMTEIYVKNKFKMDLENIWEFKDGELYLR